MAVPRACCLCVCLCSPSRDENLSEYCNSGHRNPHDVQTLCRFSDASVCCFAVAIGPRPCCLCKWRLVASCRPPPTKARLPAAHPFGSPCAGVRDVAWEQRRVCAPGVRAQVTETSVGCAPPRFSHDDHSNPPILLRSPADENLSNIKQRSSDSKKW